MKLHGKAAYEDPNATRWQYSTTVNGKVGGKLKVNVEVEDLKPRRFRARIRLFNVCVLRKVFIHNPKQRNHRIISRHHSCRFQTLLFMLISKQEEWMDGSVLRQVIREVSGVTDGNLTN